jgi:Cu/Ag efflux protein CusF
VDRVTKTVSVKAEDGRVHMIRLQNAANLEDLAKGAKVTARYQEAMLLSIARSDASPQVQTQATQDKPNGGVPAIQEVQHTSVVAQVTDVDREAKRIVLETPNGESIQMAVRDADAIKELKTGDKVVATYIEAFALSISPEDSDSPATAREAPAPDGARQR